MAVPVKPEDEIAATVRAFLAKYGAGGVPADVHGCSDQIIAQAIRDAVRNLRIAAPDRVEWWTCFLIGLATQQRAA